MAVKFGKNFRLYRNDGGTYATPTPVDMPTVQDIEAPDERGSEEYEIRGCDWTLEAVGKRKGGFTWSMLYDDADTGFVAMQESYLAATPVMLWLADGSIAELTSGQSVKGLLAWCIIKKFNRKAGMSGVATVDIEAGFHYVANELPKIHTVTGP